MIWLLAAAYAADGYVKVNGTGDPIEGALVETKDGATSAVTDEKGYFVLDVPAGTTIQVLASGFDPLQGTVPVSGRWMLYVTPSPSGIEVVVESRRDDPTVSEQKLDRERVLETPGTFEDPVRLVQSLPGVSVTPEYSHTAGDIAVRGAAPGENRFYLDGIELPYLYHYNGYASVFHTRLLDELSLYPSAQNSTWGDTTGAIVDTRSAWDPPKRLRGSVNLNLVMSGAEIQVPLNPKLSLRLSGRRSYLDLAQQDDPWYTSFPVFWDYFGRLEYRPSPDSRFGLVAFGAGDSYTRLAVDPSLLDPYEQTQDPSFTWDHSFHIFGLEHRQAGEKSSLNGSLTFTFHRRDGSLSNGSERLDDLNLAGREDLLLLLRPSLSLATGLEIKGQQFSIHADSPGILPGLEEETLLLARGISDEEKLLRLQGGLYGELRWEIGTLRLSPGIRLDADSGIGGLNVDPRLGLRWQATESTRLRAAGGRYSAFPRTEYLSQIFGQPVTEAAHAWQGAVGVDQVIAERLEFSLDGYYKSLSGLYDLDSYGELHTGLSGEAVGGEFAMHYRLREIFFSSVTVAVAHATRGEVIYDYDQPFSLNATASWTFLPTWNVGVRYRYATGLPYTPAIDGVYDATSDTYQPVYGPTNSTRLPPYQKIDLHVEKRFNAKSWNLTVYGELWYVPKPNNNMYVVYSYDYDTTEQVHGPGFVPLIGVRGEF